MLHLISTKLGQNYQWVNGYKSYQQFDYKGHVRVTGVKNVLKICFYWKCYYMLHSRVTWLKYIKKLETLYKTHRLKFRFGVILGHRGQKVIFTKNASPHTLYIVCSRDLCISTSLRSSTVFIVWNFDMGSCGVLGSKSEFNLLLNHLL